MVHHFRGAINIAGHAPHGRARLLPGRPRFDRRFQSRPHLRVTFLQPILLFGLPLALIPVIIHLLNRMRHRPRAWAAMRFLISATRSSTSNTKLRQWLILLFRTLAVAFLILFLARPLAGGWLGWALSPAPDAIIILFDRSASMETRVGGASKREQALQFLASAAKPFEETSHLVLIDSATRQPIPFSKASSLAQMDAAKPSDAAADVPAMLRAAFDWLVDNRAGTAEIWIASDAQRSNWLPDDPRWKSVVAQFTGLSQKVRIRLLSLDQSPDANVSAQLREALRRSRNGGSELRLTVDLQRNRAAAATIPLTLTLDGARSEMDVAMDGQALRWRHKTDLGARSHGGWGGVALPADANNRDNVSYFVYGPETSATAAVVSDDLQTARILGFAAAGRDGQPAARIASVDAPTMDFQKLALIVWQAPLPAGPQAESLRSFVSEGGVVVFFPTGRPDAQQFAGMGWGGVENSVDKGSPFRLRRWNEDEGPLAKSDEHFSLPLAETSFSQRQLVAGQKDSLAAFDDGAAFLTRAVYGKGEVYFCSSLPDDRWSSLSDGPVLVPMLQRLIETGAQRLQPVSTISCGELSAADQALHWTSVDSPAPKDIRVEAGVYRSGDRLLAVNRPAAEDNPEIISLDDAKKLFGDLPLQTLQEQRTQFGQAQGEIWRVFLFIMLLTLIGEGFLILPSKPRPAQPPRKRNPAAAPETSAAR